jgi:hypothetical protein
MSIRNSRHHHIQSRTHAIGPCGSRAFQLEIDGLCPFTTELMAEKAWLPPLHGGQKSHALIWAQLDGRAQVAPCGQTALPFQVIGLWQNQSPEDHRISMKSAVRLSDICISASPQVEMYPGLLRQNLMIL